MGIKEEVQKVRRMKDRKKKSIFFSQLVKEKEKRTICKFRIGGLKD